jgi:hypothetical protein
MRADFGICKIGFDAIKDHIDQCLPGKAAEKGLLAGETAIFKQFISRSPATTYREIGTVVPAKLDPSGNIAANVAE